MQKKSLFYSEYNYNGALSVDFFFNNLFTKEGECGELCKEIIDRITTRALKSVVLIGNQGCGKTTFVHHLKNELNSIANFLILDFDKNAMVEEHENLISLLCTIPGVDRNSAITIISEIGNDVSQFGSSKRLCCWAGLTPGNNESAGKKKSVRITHAGV